MNAGVSYDPRSSDVFTTKHKEINLKVLMDNMDNMENCSCKD